MQKCGGGAEGVVVISKGMQVRVGGQEGFPEERGKCRMD